VQTSRLWNVCIKVSFVAFMLAGALGLNAGRVLAASSPGSITEYTIPTANSFPTDIRVGFDGNLWFTEADAGQVVVANTSNPVGITLGTDDAFWIAMQNGNIARLSIFGSVTEYAVPGGATGMPTNIVEGVDDNIWFTLFRGNQIAVLNTGNSQFKAQFSIPSGGSGTEGITAGSDGALWFTEFYTSKIGRVTTGGQFTEYPLAANSNPTDIAVGKNGNMWFTETSGIGSISPN
jgi:virginiamycin B lyase